MSPLTLLLFIVGLTCSQVSAVPVSEAIIGGEYARKGQFKYQVSVQSGTHQCGGTIIAEHYILTAAHCVTEEGYHVYKPYEVIAGTHDLHHLKKSIIVSVEAVFIHKHFDPRTNHHDIAILKLKHGLNLGSHTDIIGKIKLPHPDANLDGADAVIAGFGSQGIELKKNKEGLWEERLRSNDEKLKIARVTIFSRKRCLEVAKGEVIHETMICGQVHQHHNHHYEGVCYGDSGGGLIHGHEVVGILSQSPFACNETTYPAKYTRVSPYLNLIKSVLSGHPGPEVARAAVPN